MLVGIDFDNTIAGYDDVFAECAVSEGLLAPDCGALSKPQVKQALQGLPNGKRKWMALQGRVYGAYMHRAALIDGVGEFLIRCKGRGIAVTIVSHKTEFGHFDPDRISLRLAALDWMEKNGFFDERGFALARRDVFFEPTRCNKVARIAALGCTHFIDDLEEVFEHPGFPAATEAVLYSHAEPRVGGKVARSYDSWAGISRSILGE